MQAEPSAREQELRCILKLGCALLSYGLPAHRVGEAVTRLARGFGHACTVFALPTFLLLTVSDERGQRSHQAHVEASTIELARLDALHTIVGRVERGEL
ncbi:MAG TPA: threonine/serine exporter family protein, partial [Polyangiales bacterium]|nr:threonine/serine exporter family protein [Polyangiales bacterium]